MNRDKWKLTNEEYEFIKGEISFIFEKYKIKCVPVCGFEIAIKMGITLIPYSALSKKKLKAALRVSQDGFCREEGGKEYIYYNNILKSYERQNWTILHELGHIVLDHTGHSEHEEDEANFFAKYAIAPPVLIHRVGAKSAWDVYKKFDISMEAAEYAYDYYCRWLNRYKYVKGYTEYEKKILMVYKMTA